MYEIVKFYEDRNPPSEIIKTGITLEEAQEYCLDPETSSSTCSNICEEETSSSTCSSTGKENRKWFCGYRLINF